MNAERTTIRALFVSFSALQLAPYMSTPCNGAFNSRHLSYKEHRHILSFPSSAVSERLFSIRVIKVKKRKNNVREEKEDNRFESRIGHERCKKRKKSIAESSCYYCRLRWCGSSTLPSLSRQSHQLSPKLV